jgi:hypothetical protein
MTVVPDIGQCVQARAFRPTSRFRDAVQLMVKSRADVKRSKRGYADIAPVGAISGNGDMRIIRGSM